MAGEGAKPPTREERIDELVRKMVELEGVDPDHARGVAVKYVDEPSGDRAPTVADLRRILDEYGA